MRKINTTDVPTIIVKKDDLETKYPFIGYGSEGEIYRYDDSTVLKRFSLCRALKVIDVKLANRKLKKVEELIKLSDESICFPIGIFGFEDMYMEGCVYPLIRYNVGLKDFEDLELLDIDQRIDLLIEGSKVLQRIHSLGLVVGDVKEDNIMVNENSIPVFVDVDNYAYGEYQYDLYPTCASMRKIFKYKNVTATDNDIMLYTLLCLRTIFNKKNFNFQTNKLEILELIHYLDVPNYIKENLYYLLSDSKDKTYPTPMLLALKDNLR